jgi:hypothetical protein
MIEPENLVSKIMVLKSRHKSMRDQKKRLVETFIESDKVASELRRKASEASRLQELTIAHLSGSAAPSHELKYDPQRERDDGKQSFKYAERKLGIKHNIVVLLLLLLLLLLLHLLFLSFKPHFLSLQYKIFRNLRS